MNIYLTIFLFAGSAGLALLFGCLGAHLIEETILGWPLFLAGASFPPGAVLYYRRIQSRIRGKKG